MEIDDIKKLVELMEERGVVELEMEDRKGKIRLVRENHRAPAPVSGLAATPPLPTLVSPMAPPSAPDRQAAEQAPAPGTGISPPLGGAFYRAPSPDAQP